MRLHNLQAEFRLGEHIETCKTERSDKTLKDTQKA